MMRPLPVLIEPFAGETVSSVYRRLADRNAVPAGELWTTIRHARPRLPLRTTPELVPRMVEELADLPPGFFDGRRSDRLFVRCIHTDWRHSNCPTCAPLPSAVTKCMRCTRGEPVEVRTRTGAVCARHRRWHYAGADDALTDCVEHLRAERCLTGTLWERGIGPDTGELELATGAAVNAVTVGPSRDVDAVRASFHADGRETVISRDRPVRLRYGRSPGLDELGRRILTFAPRVRAILLRHTDARNPPTRRPRLSSRHAQG